MKRRHFRASLSTVSATVCLPASGQSTPLPAKALSNRIGVSSYSFWGFNRQDLRPIDICLEHAAAKVLMQEKTYHGGGV